MPNILSGNQDSVVFAPDNASKKYANEYAIYAQDDWEINPKLKLNIGLRYSLFQQVGKYIYYNRDANGNKTDSTVYMTKEGKWASPVEPRGLNNTTYLELIKPYRINFITPIEFSYEEKFEKSIKEKFSDIYSTVKDGKITVNYGYYAEDLFEIRKKNRLKEYDYLINE